MENPDRHHHRHADRFSRVSRSPSHHPQPARRRLCKGIGENMFAVFITVFIILAAVAGYVFFVRPMLRQWASLKDFWASTDELEVGLWGKIKALFDGIKIKLLAR